MSVETVKSTLITNRDATPAVPQLTEKAVGFLKEIMQVVTVAASASSASKYILAQLPSNCRLSKLAIACESLGSATAADFGLWRTTADGGAVVDRDRLASAQALSAAIAYGSETDITSESADTSITDVEKPLWELLGLSTDPKINYDLVAYLTTGADGGGKLMARVQYV